jgi:hypothetical protein
LSYIPTSDPQWVGFYRTTTQILFYIDQATSTVSKIEYQNFAENDSNVQSKVEVFIQLSTSMDNSPPRARGVGRQALPF